jgi:hypothetical protein
MIAFSPKFAVAGKMAGDIRSQPQLYRLKKKAQAKSPCVSFIQP